MHVSAPCPLQVIKTSFDYHGDCSGNAAESSFCKCIEDSQALTSYAMDHPDVGSQPQP